MTHAPDWKWLTRCLALGGLSVIWFCVVAIAWILGRGGIVSLMPPTRPAAGGTGPASAQENTWSAVFLGGPGTGWEWMVRVPEHSGPDASGVPAGLKMRIPSSAWFSDKPGVIPVRRKVDPAGKSVAELWASTGYATGEELVRALAAGDGWSVDQATPTVWRMARGDSVWECRWLEKESVPAGTRASQGKISGWMLVSLLNGEIASP